MTAGVDLRSDEAIERNERVGFRVVGGLDPIDPHLNPRSLGKDAIVVPALDIDGF